MVFRPLPRKVCDPGDQVAGRVGSAALAAANIERHRGGTMACLVDVFGGWQIGKLENIVTLVWPVYQLSGSAGNEIYSKPTLQIAGPLVTAVPLRVPHFSESQAIQVHKFSKFQ